MRLRSFLVLLVVLSTLFCAKGRRVFGPLLGPALESLLFSALFGKMSVPMLALLAGRITLRLLSISIGLLRRRFFRSMHRRSRLMPLALSLMVWSGADVSCIQNILGRG